MFGLSRREHWHDPMVRPLIGKRSTSDSTAVAVSPQPCEVAERQTVRCELQMPIYRAYYLFAELRLHRGKVLRGIEDGCQLAAGLTEAEVRGVVRSTSLHQIQRPQ